MAGSEFAVFPNLPAEICLTIWNKALSNSNLIIDLWTEFRRCENTDAIFYHQYYGTKLTDTHSRVLEVTRESRVYSFPFERLLTTKT
jgi:N-acetyl-gamma-glutamylphosphate reductase